MQPSSASKASLYCFVPMLRVLCAPRQRVALVVCALLAGMSLASAQDTGARATCADAAECRRLAFDAEANGDFERFHDLAWRAVQIGRANDSALMYQLARAQVLSGRPHDALVMVRRLAEMGIATDAATSDEFARTRALPEWPEVAARMARVPAPVIIEAPSGAAMSTPTGAATSRASDAATPTPAAATPSASATRRALKPATTAAVGAPSAAPTPAAAIVVSTARSSTPFPLKAVRGDEAARFTADRFSSGGLAYDTVSQRFIIGDALGRKLMVVGLGAAEPTDMVRSDSAGFQDVAAVEIDERRGDLWVASTATGDPGGAVHRLQLVSGRPLRTYRPAAARGATQAIDLAIAPSGTILALDAARASIFTLARGATELTETMALQLSAPTSLAAGEDEGLVYVAHAAGIARVDLRTRTTAAVSSGRGFDLTGLERIRRYRGSIIGAQRLPDGGIRIVRLDLGINGRSVTDASVIDASAGGRPFLSISGDEIYYLAETGAPGSPASVVIRRLHLR